MRLPIARFAVIGLLALISFGTRLARAENIGFVDSGGSYTSYSAPGASDTFVTGINDADQLAGYYSLSGQHFQGFLYSGGGYTTLSVPGSYATYGNAINNDGEVVGFYGVGSGLSGFTYNAGSYNSLNAPGADHTVAMGVNNSGQVVGLYYQTGSQESGFLYSGGTYTSLNVSGADWTDALAINDNGEIVGNYEENGQIGTYTYSQGIYTVLPLPNLQGLWQANPYGLNNAGQITGSLLFLGGQPDEGFIYSGGTYTTLGPPNALSTDVYGINDLQQIVGSYQPGPPPTPEPSAWVLLASALLMSIALLYRRRHGALLGRPAGTVRANFTRDAPVATASS